MNFSNHENSENLTFLRVFDFLPLLDHYKSKPGEISKIAAEQFRSTSNNVIYLKKFVLGLNRFYRGHFQNSRNIKTFFSHADDTLRLAAYSYNVVKKPDTSKNDRTKKEPGAIWL